MAMDVANMNQRNFFSAAIAGDASDITVVSANAPATAIANCFIFTPIGLVWFYKTRCSSRVFYGMSFTLL